MAQKQHMTSDAVPVTSDLSALSNDSFNDFSLHDMLNLPQV